MKIDYMAKTVTLTFEEMKGVQTNLSEALRMARSEAKDANPSAVRYCIRGTADNLYLTGFERQDKV